MKLSYSKRWILFWLLLIVGILVTVSGLFTLPSSILQATALLLFGMGLSGPAVWWLRYGSRKAGESRMLIASSVGAVFLVAGGLMMPWNSYVAATSTDENTAEETTSSAGLDDETEAETTSRSRQAITSGEPRPIISSLTQTVPISTTEPTVTVTESETLIPSTVTVISSVPVQAPQRGTPQNSVPRSSGPGQSEQTERAPDEGGDSTSTERAPEEISDSEPHERVLEGDTEREPAEPSPAAAEGTEEPDVARPKW